MIDLDHFIHSGENDRMLADNRAAAHGMNADLFFFPQRVFAETPVGQGFAVIQRLVHGVR